MVKTKSNVTVGAEPKQAATNKRAMWLAVILLSVGLSELAVVPFFYMGKPSGIEGVTELNMPVTHDMHLHFEQMKSFYNGMSAGEIYPRWEEDTNRRFGAPTTSYYPPAIYYFTSLFYAVSGDWWKALLNMHVFMMLASAAAIYLYARRAMSRGAACVAMAAYIVAPYHLVDQYQRGALAELLGFIWMPLMLYFAERLFDGSATDYVKAYGVEAPAGEPSTARLLSRRLSDAAGLALSYGAFLWSHPPTAYQFTLAFGLFAVLLAAFKRDFKGLIRVGCAMALGAALSAAYLYPAAIEQDLIRHEYVSDTWPYHSTYVFLHDLPYSGGHRGFFNLIDGIWSFCAMIIAAAAAVIVVPAVRRRSGARWMGMTEGLTGRALLWLAMGLLACFMMLQISAPIGRLIPKLDIGVFTWRMLAITSLVVSLIAGACAEAAFNASRAGRSRARLALISTALFITIGSAAFSLFGVMRPMYKAPLMIPSYEHLNFATIPRTAPEDPELLPELGPAQLGGGKGEVFVQRWDPEHRSMRVELEEADRLLVRTFNFPGWTATVNGSRAPIATDEELGRIVLELPAGAHQVELDFLNTPARRAGAVVSASALALTALLLIASFLLRALQKRRRGSFSH